MTRYFFDVHEDKNLIKDEDGLEFATIEAVREEAQRILMDLAREEIPGITDRKT